MSLRETLELLVTMDPSAGVAGFDALGKKSEETSKRVGDNLGKIGSASLKLGAAGLGAGLFLTQMADKDEQSLNSLKASIEQTGGSYDEFKDRIDSTVGSQAKFGHTDGEVTAALSTLTLGLGSTSAALDRMQLVSDYAAKKGVSLSDAASVIAKVAGGATRPLKELGIEAQSTGNKSADAAANLDAMTQRLSGQSKAAVSGFTGQLTVLRAEIENQVSAFGAKWGPTMMVVSGALTAFGAVASGVAPVVRTLAAARAADATAADIEAASSLKAKVAMAGVGLAGVAAVAGLYAYGKSLNKTALDQGDLNQVMSASKVQANHLIDAYVSMTGTFGDFANVLQQLAQQGDAGIGTLKEYRQHLVDTGQSTEKVDAVLKDAADSQANLNAKTAEGATVTGTATAATLTYADTLKALDDQIHGTIDPLFGYENALIANRKAQNDASDAAKDGKHSQDEIQAANIKAAESALAVKDAADKLSVAMQNGSVKLDEGRQILQGWVDQGLLTQQQADNITWSIGQIPADKNVTITADASQANAVLNQINSRISNDPLLKYMGVTSLPHFADGGVVPGPPGKPQLAVVHGGEVVIPTKGMAVGGSGSSTGGNPAGNTYITINALDPQAAAKAVRDVIASDTRRNGNALAKSISR